MFLLFEYLWGTSLTSFLLVLDQFSVWCCGHSEGSLFESDFVSFVDPIWELFQTQRRHLDTHWMPNQFKSSPSSLLNIVKRSLTMRTLISISNILLHNVSHLNDEDKSFRLVKSTLFCIICNILIAKKYLLLESHFKEPF